MIISHQHKFIFIKTRKTAGSSLEKILYNYLGEDDICTGSERDGTPKLNTTSDKGHSGYNYLRKHHPDSWNNYFSFAVERNPWDKMVSHYYWELSKGSFKARGGFKSFILRFADRYSDWNKYADTNCIKVDKVFKYETLDIDLYKTTQIPYNRELTTVFVKNNTRKQKPGKDYRSYYETVTRRKVKEVFRNEINLLGYKFS